MREAVPLWTVDLPLSLVGSMTPVYDRARRSILISDGWGASYGTIRLRRIALSDGTISSSSAFRGAAYGATFTGDDHILIALGKQILLLDGETLHERELWRSKVPTYSNHIALVGRKLAMMNGLGPSLSLYDLDKATVTRARLGSCTALVAQNEQQIWVCSGKEGKIVAFDAATKRSTILLETVPFMHAEICPNAGVAALGMGVPFRQSESTIEWFADSTQIRLVSLVSGEFFIQQGLVDSFRHLKLSPDRKHLFVAHANRVVTYAIGTLKLTKVAEAKVPYGFATSLIVPELSLAVAMKSKSNGSSLTAFPIA